MMQEVKSFAESEQDQGKVEEVGGDSGKCKSIFSLANTLSLGLFTGPVW